MSHFRIFRESATAGLLTLAALAPAATFQYDIVVNGGSFSAVAAAFSAARENPSAEVLLIEPTD